MKRSLLEYLATDMYIMLFLTADGHSSKHKPTVKTVMREQFDPDVVQLFQNDLGIPSMISVSDYKFELDDDGNLHGLDLPNSKPSFSCDLMTLSWVDEKWEHEDTTVNQPRLDRTGGPALITLRDFSTYHRHGERSGFACNSWSFRWYHNRTLNRDRGPHSVHGDQIRAVVDNKGTLLAFDKTRVSHSWCHPGDGRVIISKDVSATLEDNDINANLMSPTDTVFENALDEAAFYLMV